MRKSRNWGHVWFLFLRTVFEKLRIIVFSESSSHCLDLVFFVLFVFFRIKNNWEPNVFSLFSLFFLFLRTESGFQK